MFHIVRNVMFHFDLTSAVDAGIEEALPSECQGA